MSTADPAAAPEARMASVLKEKLGATVVDVRDVSGGCGSFYQVLVVSTQFAGMTTMKQHRAVTELLESDIGKMHGLTIKTMTPEQFEAAKAKQAASAAGAK